MIRHLTILGDQVTIHADQLFQRDHEPCTAMEDRQLDRREVEVDCWKFIDVRKAHWAGCLFITLFPVQNHGWYVIDGVSNEEHITT